MQSTYFEPTTTPVVGDDQDMIRNHEQIEKAGQTSSLSTPPIFQPVQGSFFYHGYAEETIFKRGANAKKVESSLDKFTRIPFSESTENVTNHRKGAYTPISLEVWQTLTWRPHINNAVQAGSCLGFEIVSDITATRHLKTCGKSRRKTVNIMNVETEAELMQRNFLL